jgi:hypothetical protein
MHAYLRRLLLLLCRGGLGLAVTCAAASPWKSSSFIGGTTNTMVGYLENCWLDKVWNKVNSSLNRRQKVIPQKQKKISFLL